jgi:hypothetical protein
VPVLVDGPGWCVMIGHDATVAYRSASRADAELVADCYRDTIAAALRDAVAAEREACAKVADEIAAPMQRDADDAEGWRALGAQPHCLPMIAAHVRRVARSIRARGGR